MKKLIIIFASMFILLAPVAVFATVGAQADPSNPLGAACQGKAATDSAACQTAHSGSSNPIFGKDGIIIKGAQIIALMTGIAAVIVIIISGFRYVVSSGDPSSVESAKNAILYALIGLIIAAMAEVIVAFVVTRL